MLTKKDIAQLANLARINISEAEQEGLVRELDAVLAYVSEIASITTEAMDTPKAGELRNVMREDTDVYPGGTFTPLILANAPGVEDGFLKVKQIL